MKSSTTLKVLFVFLLLLVGFVGLKKLGVVETVYDNFVETVADKVILKLQKEYSPSPYGPGLDPDKIDVTKFHNLRGHEASAEINAP